MPTNINLHPNKGGALSKHLNSGTMDSEIIYGDGKHGSLGEETFLEVLDKKVIIEQSKRMVFSQFGGTTNIPMHSGKAISKEVILPIMDERNLNDQGIDANGVTIENGNLMGGSRDFGSLTSPVLTEHGGRVNRVGMTKQKVTGSICKYGFALEYSKDSFQFTNTRRMEAHVRREMLRAASEIYELTLSKDLINSAGVVKYGGEALSFGDMTGEVNDVVSQLTYKGIMRLSDTLDENNTPMDTTIIKGHTNEDTKVISAARFAIIPPELVFTLDKMKDSHGDRAFVRVKHYAAANGNNIAEGEVGAVGELRFIVNRFSGTFNGVGKTVVNNAGFKETNGRYDVFPMVIVGSGSFSTISLRGGKTGKKWDIRHITPEKNVSTLDYYGETGFFAIKWYYGTLIERPERIAVYYSVAEL